MRISFRKKPGVAWPVRKNKLILTGFITGAGLGRPGTLDLGSGTGDQGVGPNIVGRQWAIQPSREDKYGTGADDHMAGTNTPSTGAPASETEGTQENTALQERNEGTPHIGERDNKAPNVKEDRKNTRKGQRPKYGAAETDEGRDPRESKKNSAAKEHTTQEIKTRESE